MLVVISSSARAQTLTSTLTAPIDGATGVNPLQPIQWTEVDDAEAYVLWVGTSPGAKDVVNTVELQQTAYQPAYLPPNQTLYARIWTRVGGIWRFSASTFSAAPLTATLTVPADAATNVSPLQLLQWTSVSNAQAYVLWVGTSPGANDAVNTVELQQTSYQSAMLPANQTLYARMWTKVGNVWRYTDSTFATASLTATLISPANGATNVNPLQAIQWTAVLNAQAYVLWIGTAVGAHDVVNTVELQQTSYQPPALPAGRTLYARMWACVGGVWRFTDSTFTAASLTASLTAPPDGATNVGPLPLFQWTSVLGAQAYVLWVGTTPASKNLLGTDEMPQTSYQSPVAFGVNQTLYARTWAKAGGTWRYTDSTFRTQTVPATIIAPANGASNVSPLQPVQWTSVPSAEAYALWVGTTAGGNDVVNSGELQQASYQPASLPESQTLYARVWTRISGTWYHTDSTFTAATLVARLTYPADGAQNVDDSVPASWAAVAGAEAYVLDVGSTPGASDRLQSAETQQTSWSFLNLPPNSTLYARLWTKAGGVWRYSDSTFEISSIAPEFTYPLDGATGVNVSQPFAWTIARNADAYDLVIGTDPLSSDLLDSGPIAGTSFAVAGLSHAGPLYARVWARVNGQWSRHSDIGFTLDPTVPPSTIVTPFDGESSFSTSRPFEWTAVALARGYRLTIGTTPGAADLHDSGEIHTLQRFSGSLPLGVPLYGRVLTKIDGQWYPTDFSFTASDNSVSSAGQIKAALRATDFVRAMATDDDSHPYDWTELREDPVWPRYWAVCSDFATVLLRVLTDLNLSLPSRRLNIAFDTNGLDGHTLVELWNPEAADWMLLDPTFDLTITREDGSFANAADVSDATRNFNWSAISYQFLGAAGSLTAADYYIDYPLLYLNIAQPAVIGQGASPLPYLQAMPMPAAAAPAPYLIRCFGSDSATVLVDGSATILACNGIDALSPVFWASTVALPADSTAVVQLYTLRRFVF